MSSEKRAARKWSAPEIEELEIDLTAIANFQKRSGDGAGTKGVAS